MKNIIVALITAVLIFVIDVTDKYGVDDSNTFLALEDVNEIKFYRNLPIISRLMGQKLTKEQATTIVEIIKDSRNFDWGETTWAIRETDFFFRFYDSEEKELGKFWVCFEACGMTAISPQLSSTKYGNLSERGKSNFTELIKEITSPVGKE